MGTINDVLGKYQILGDYCEKFWSQTYAKYRSYISCHAGCGICCELQSVNLLETFIISNYLKKAPFNSIREEENKCIFLSNDKCSIYRARPLICRTHGLAMKSREFTSSYSITCPFNFFNYESEIPSDAILDIDKTTENLMKLNVAFCMILGKKKLSAERFLLVDIAQNNLSDQIQNLFNV